MSLNVFKNSTIKSVSTLDISSMVELYQPFMYGHDMDFLAYSDASGDVYRSTKYDVTSAAFNVFRRSSVFTRRLSGPSTAIRLADAVSWSATAVSASATADERATASVRYDDFISTLDKVATELKDDDNAASSLMQLISKLFLLDGDAIVTVDLDKLFPEDVGPFFGNGGSNKLYFRFDKSTIGHVAMAHLQGVEDTVQRRSLDPLFANDPTRGGIVLEIGVYPLIHNLFDIEDMGKLPLMVGCRLIIFGSPSIGKSYEMNLYAIMHIAAKLPFATYREADQILSIFIQY
jgi:hypothetical protein